MGASALVTVKRFRDLIDDLRSAGKQISIEQTESSFIGR
jgi:hypothetical protein